MDNELRKKLRLYSKGFKERLEGPTPTVRSTNSPYLDEQEENPDKLNELKLKAEQALQANPALQLQRAQDDVDAAYTEEEKIAAKKRFQDLKARMGM